MALANAVAAKVQATVFSQVLGSGSWSDERWLLAFTVSHDGPVPYVSAIDRQAMVLSVKRFIAAVGSDLMIDTEDLAALAKVSLQRLSERMGAKS